jgi:hypothetical protein
MFRQDLTRLGSPSVEHQPGAKATFSLPRRKWTKAQRKETVFGGSEQAEWTMGCSCRCHGPFLLNFSFILGRTGGAPRRLWFYVFFLKLLVSWKLLRMIMELAHDWFFFFCCAILSHWSNYVIKDKKTVSTCNSLQWPPPMRQECDSMSSRYPHNNPVRFILLSRLLHRWGNWRVRTTDPSGAMPSTHAKFILVYICMDLTKFQRLGVRINLSVNLTGLMHS